ncbi:hypothetical protein SELMODRAFT_169212 [Selaginella moellendorffii]|uniref:HR-like lesion-inducer n=1 Tax=Selaginella moellendorffii TaxID=88036 RepID=D8R9M1_SELML|nr:uncharacterized protein LOC9632799 isoform X2 [Selaginella moellendorffii]EFJ31176.1 hypothetical protein SELMODRAFT_169212 [Selaginella moellendorffii]|eukprot:XP_002967829.1 uncharacterized protein LOC9632799 isoform X2 [Selaginella moellendorffii]
MGFLSFSGRVLFSSIFILSAWQKVNDFGGDGGGAARLLQPKFFTLSHHLESRLGWNLLSFNLKYVVFASILLQGLGGILFTFGSVFGAYLLLLDLFIETPIWHDFYNFDVGTPEYANEFLQFLKSLSLCGALLYFVGMKRAHSKRFRKKQQIKVKTT